MTDIEGLLATLRSELDGTEAGVVTGAGVDDGTVLVVERGGQVHLWGVPPALPDPESGWLSCPACGRKDEQIGRARRFCTGSSATGRPTHSPTEMGRLE